MAEINFQANPNDTQEGFPLIPAGDYVAIISNSELKDTKDVTNNDKYLNLEWTIVDGDQKNKKIFEILNLFNKNQQTVEISRKSMNAICLAVGKPDGVKDSSELHNKPILIKISVKKDDQYVDKNYIKSHSKYDGQSIGQNSNQGEEKLKPWQKP